MEAFKIVQSQRNTNGVSPMLHSASRCKPFVNVPGLYILPLDVNPRVELHYNR